MSWVLRSVSTLSWRTGAFSPQRLHEGDELLRRQLFGPGSAVAADGLQRGGGPITGREPGELNRVCQALATVGEGCRDEQLDRWVGQRSGAAAERDQRGVHVRLWPEDRPRYRVEARSLRGQL